MNDPDAKDYRWLVARERGDDISHVMASERAPYEELGALLASGLAPSAGWKQRVLDAIDAEERAAAPPPPPPPTPVEPEPAAAVPATAAAQVVPIGSRWRRRIWIVAGPLAAAAALVLFVVPRIGGGGEGLPPGPALAVDTSVLDTSTKHRAMGTRGDQAKLGDTLVVHATAIGPAELRVYGGSSEQVLASCREGNPCVTRDGERRQLKLEVLLEMPGDASAVVFHGADLPPTTGSLTGDLEAAARAGIELRKSRRTRVY
jgi:hypothetical protein